MFFLIKSDDRAKESGVAEMNDVAVLWGLAWTERDGSVRAVMCWLMSRKWSWGAKALQSLKKDVSALFLWINIISELWDKVNGEKKISFFWINKIINTVLLYFGFETLWDTCVFNLANLDGKVTSFSTLWYLQYGYLEEYSYSSHD